MRALDWSILIVSLNLAGAPAPEKHNREGLNLPPIDMLTFRTSLGSIYALSSCPSTYSTVSVGINANATIGVGASLFSGGGFGAELVAGLPVRAKVHVVLFVCLTLTYFTSQNNRLCIRYLCLSSAEKGNNFLKIGLLSLTAVPLF
jgi:hypothetical protein